MITLGKLLLVLFGLLDSLINYVRERRLRKAGEDQILAEVQNDQINEIEKAKQARDKASTDNATVSSTSSLPDDGFRRD